MSYELILIITSASIAAAALIWFYLVKLNSSRDINTSRLILLLILGGLLFRLLLTILTPTFYAPDEVGHFNYVKYIYEKRALPVYEPETAVRNNEFEYYQPPLYYLALMPSYAAAKFLNFDEDITVRILRLSSIILWLINLLFGIKILDRLKIGNEFIRVFFIGMLSLLPTYLFISSVINNDNLVVTLAGAYLLIFSGKTSLKNSIAIGLIIGLALITKLTAAVLFIPVISLMLIKFLKKEILLNQAVLYLLVVCIVSFVLYAPVGFRNTALYGSFMALSIGNEPAAWRSVFHSFIEIQDNIKETFWSASGHYMRQRFLPGIGIHLTYLGIIGLIWGYIKKKENSLIAFESSTLMFVQSTTLGVIVNLLLVLWFGMIYAQGQGRFLFTMLFPIALLLAAGLNVFIQKINIKNITIHTAGFFLLYAAGFTAYSLTAFSRRFVTG
jgi:4-amino-4-deoxy-L-arabinose transferase-like glycosyltransferase